jgi:hypothetical protein
MEGHGIGSILSFKTFLTTRPPNLIENGKDPLNHLNFFIHNYLLNPVPERANPALFSAKMTPRVKASLTNFTHSESLKR